MMSKNKGFNTAKTDYNENFMLACESELQAKKWVTITSWLIR